MTIWPLRSMLFIPAHKLDWVRKVNRYRPDSVVIDLEDAVPTDLKEAARDMAREGISILRAFDIPAFVRINALHQGGVEDIRRAVVAGLAGIMLPKAGQPEEIRELDRLLSHAEGAAGLEYRSTAILPLPETAEGLWNARELALASKRVKGLIGVVGGPVAGDVARAMGFRPSAEAAEQMYLWSKIVLDSRAAQARYPMASIIGTRIEDHDAVRRLVGHARSFGFSGAVLIHPSHVPIANEAYTPTREEVRYFAGLIAAMRAAEGSGDAAVSYEGAMVDYAMMPLAEEVLREAKRRGISAS